MTYAATVRLSSSSSPMAVPGPIDRTSFFAEQQRNRRATWRLFVACTIAILFMGIPLCLVVTPLLYAVLLFCVHVVDLIIPQPELLTTLGTMSQAALFGLVYVMESLVDTPSQDIPPYPYLACFLFIVPGISFIAILWWGVQTVLLERGGEEILSCLGARAPRFTDNEEQQLVNLVEEMTLAAGLPAPRVTLLDSSVANAAAIGSSPTDATLVVSRALLDEFDRNETQAIIGHLVGSVGNGDLRIAFMMLSVFLTFSVLVNVLSTPFSPKSRSLLRQLLHLGVSTKRRHLDEQTGTTLIQVLLTQGLGVEDDKDFDQAMETSLGKIGLPIIFSALTVKMTLFVFISFLLGPAIALLWRTRRYLADATAVQLTRDPNSLAQALMRLATKGGIIPGTQAIAHLGIVNHKAGQGQASETSTVTMKGTLSESLGDSSFVSLQPPLTRRLERLQQLGATVVSWHPKGFWERSVLDTWKHIGALGPVKATLVVCLLMLLVVLMPIAVVGLFLVVAMLTMLNVMLMGFLLLGIHGVFTLLTFLKAWVVS